VGLIELPPDESDGRMESMNSVFRHATTRTGALHLVSRVLACAVGLVLILAAFMKATDMEIFARQIKAYGIVIQPVVVAAGAWALIALECFLGMGLLVLYRPAVTFRATAILWVIFLAVTSWAWSTGATEECGCYGSWSKHTPRDAVIENLILLAATLTAWVGLRTAPQQQARAKAWAVAVAGAIGLALPIGFGSNSWWLNPPHLENRGFELGHVRVEGLGDMDLNHGTYLIALMGTDCLHCQEAVFDLNLLGEAGDLPPLLALCACEEFRLQQFVEEFHCTFPIGRIQEKDFFRLLAEGELPRLLLSQNGKVERVWNQTVPPRDEIIVSLSSGSSP